MHYSSDQLAHGANLKNMSDQNAVPLFVARTIQNYFQVGATNPRKLKLNLNVEFTNTLQLDIKGILATKL